MSPRATPSNPVHERPEVVARRSPRVVRFMVAYFHRFFGRHMNALRVARWGRPSLPERDRPLVIYSNHPSWWDGALYVLLGWHLFRDYQIYVPIDEAMLEKYGVFTRMGGYGVELETRRGAVAFLRTTSGILGQPGRAVMVTAQGRFTDQRQRPLELRSGIAHLPDHVDDALFLPLAFDYTFWEERGAEALVAFGPPIDGASLLAMPRAQRLDELESALTRTLDRLSEDAMSREPDRFETLVAGKQGIGGIYDLWRRMRAASRGERFDPAHGGRAS